MKRLDMNELRIIKELDLLPTVCFTTNDEQRV